MNGRDEDKQQNTQSSATNIYYLDCFSILASGPSALPNSSARAAALGSSGRPEASAPLVSLSRRADGVSGLPGAVSCDCEPKHAPSNALTADGSSVDNEAGRIMDARRI
jgi:hypothetical protein